MSSMMKLIRRVCKIRWMNRKRITLRRKMGSRCIWNFGDMSASLEVEALLDPNEYVTFCWA